LTIPGAASLTIPLFLPPVFQDPNYRNFADRRTVLGIPNFRNVASNAALSRGGSVRSPRAAIKIRLRGKTGSELRLAFYWRAPSWLRSARRIITYSQTPSAI
jgi:hypothetical protein